MSTSARESTTLRVVSYVAGLGVLFAVALGAGSLWGPSVAAPTHGATHDEGTETAGHDAMTAADHLPGGLMRSQDGYTLTLERSTATSGDATPLAFTITRPDGGPVTAFDVEHDKELHLIVVRRDLTGFQHVHPTRDDSGRWTTDVALRPGSWRVFADFVPTGGPDLTLGTDLQVPGRVPTGDPVSAEARTAEVDGYTVSIAGDLVGGSGSELTTTITRAGSPVTDLEPYLGAFGHLVALREGDLAYLHVHPRESDTAGPEVDFTAEVPSEGAYRLFLDFRHDGAVHTAVFDLTAERP